MISSEIHSICVMTVTTEYFDEKDSIDEVKDEFQLEDNPSDLGSGVYLPYLQSHDQKYGPCCEKHRYSDIEGH